MMKIVNALVILSTLGVCHGHVNNFKVEVCSDALNDMGIEDIQLPNYVVAGEEITVSVSHQPNKHINQGKFSVELDVEGVKVASQSYELCEVADVPNCQLHAHKKSNSLFNFHIPQHTPQNFKTTLKVVVNDHNGAQLSCVTAENVPVASKFPKNGGLRIQSGGLELSHEQFEFLFSKWTKQYGINYNVREELLNRKKIFADNLEQVALHNFLGNSSYELHMNEFAAQTQDEFSNSHFGFNGGENQPKINRDFYQIDVEELTSLQQKSLPASIDWTTKGAVTPVKNQGSCGSCWAFSTTGGLEGAYYLKTGKLVSFSEQNLVSCDHVDQGCNGGLMDNADRFIQRNHGLCTEEDYPYVSGRGGRALCKKCNVVDGSIPKQIVDVQHTEESMEAAVAKRPVSVAIEADQMSFQFYRRGVLTGNCGSRLDHGVLVVGYGTLNGQKYFKVKNSWGPSWGQNGYILIQRGKQVRGGECGVLLSASYPIL